MIEHSRTAPAFHRPTSAKLSLKVTFLPVRMEQQKNGRTEMVFILKSVEGL
ncbi:MAG: hypothetical protein O6930_04070 [Gammaproteobacteria bacterium]|nr:hypothetical protein [Gammaproteobacteria bacterium]